MSASLWHVRLMGSAILTGSAGGELRLERKLAAALAYLALEGATPRSRLAGLLWPESPEATARNNLSQMLRKLRLAVGPNSSPGATPLTCCRGWRSM